MSYHHGLLRKHIVGKWQIKHIIPNAGEIVGFLSPIYKQQLMRFLGMVDLYSIFCFNFGTIFHPRVSLVEQERITLPLRFLVVFVLLYL